MKITIKATCKTTLEQLSSGDIFTFLETIDDNNIRAYIMNENLETFTALSDGSIEEIHEENAVYPVIKADSTEIIFNL